MNIELFIFSLIVWTIAGLMLLGKQKRPIKETMTKGDCYVIIAWAGPFMWIATLISGCIIFIMYVLDYLQRRKYEH